MLDIYEYYLLSNSRVSKHNGIQSGPFSLDGDLLLRCHAKLQSEVRESREPLQFCSNVLCAAVCTFTCLRTQNGLYDGEDGNLSICFTHLQLYFWQSQNANTKVYFQKYEIFPKIYDLVNQRQYLCFIIFTHVLPNNINVSTLEEVTYTIEPYLALVEAIGSDDSPKRCLLIMAFVEKQPSFSRQYCSFSHHHNNLKLFLLEIRSYSCNRYFYDSQVWVGGM